MTILGWVAVFIVSLAIICLELLRAPVMKEEKEVSALLWWVVGMKDNEQRRRAYFAADPDAALYRWEQDYGKGWKIRAVTLNADFADKILGF